MKARGRPLIEHLFLTRTDEEFRGNFCSFFDAEKNSSSVVAEFARIAFNSARKTENLVTRATRFLLRSIAEVFGMTGIV
jgi:hypothetical protein